MRTNVRLDRLIGFRLVSHKPDGLAHFYSALGFEVGDERPIEPAEIALLGLSGRATRRSMRLGEARVDLDNFERVGATYPVIADATSRCFQHMALVTEDVGAAWAKAQAAGATLISREGPVTLPATSGGVIAIKFRDPEGHPLELIRFSDDDMQKWPGTGLLGIDHSAIVASDLDASETFYAAAGLSRGSATLNRGPDQDALDGIDGACADVVPWLSEAVPPHVELLHYRSPGSPPSRPWNINDVVATRMVWKGEADALLRDPDGHLHQVES